MINIGFFSQFFGNTEQHTKSCRTDVIHKLMNVGTEFLFQPMTYLYIPNCHINLWWHLSNLRDFCFDGEKLNTLQLVVTGLIEQKL